MPMMVPDRLNKGALEGVRVLDISRMLPGPYCSMILADHGAKVIAVEDRRYEAEGAFIPSLYRNKSHMTLDLKHPKGREVFFKLMETMDVLIEGFRPGVAARLGVDYATVSQVNPGIIYCAITGFGQSGPYRDRAGHDVNYLGMSGILHLIGAPDRPPSIPGVQMADIAAGGMNGAIGILLALLARQRTGKGQYVDISMTDGMVAFLPVALLLAGLLGHPLERSQALLSHRYACYNTYETSDGRHLAIGAVENRFWKNLCDAFQKPEYTVLQFDEARRLEIIDFFRNAFRERALQDWEKILGDLEVCFSAIRKPEEVLQDPHFIRRKMVTHDPDRSGETVLGVPVKLSETPGSIRSPAKRFGADTVAVLGEVGYTQGQIQELKAEGVI